MTKAEIIQIINDNIYQNANGEITGKRANFTLIKMLEYIGYGGNVRDLINGEGELFEFFDQDGKIKPEFIDGSVVAHVDLEDGLGTIVNGDQIDLDQDVINSLSLADSSLQQTDKHDLLLYTDTGIQNLKDYLLGLISANIYDEFMYKEFADQSSIDLSEALPYYVVKVDSDYYFSSDENNVEQFENSRVYIPETGERFDLDDANFNQDSYGFYLLDGFAGALTDLENYDFQFWLRYGTGNGGGNLVFGTLVNDTSFENMAGDEVVPGVNIIYAEKDGELQLDENRDNFIRFYIWDEINNKYVETSLRSDYFYGGQATDDVDIDMQYDTFTIHEEKTSADRWVSLFGDYTNSGSDDKIMHLFKKLPSNDIAGVRLSIEDLTEKRTIKFPDKAGTIALESDIPDFTGDEFDIVLGDGSLENDFFASNGKIDENYIPDIDNYGFWTVTDGTETIKINSEETLTFDDEYFELDGSTIRFLNSGLATEDWVEDKNYLTDHQDLSEYAKIIYVDGFGYKLKLGNNGKLQLLDKDNNVISEQDLSSLFTGDLEIVVEGDDIVFKQDGTEVGRIDVSSFLADVVVDGERSGTILKYLDSNNVELFTIDLAPLLNPKADKTTKVIAGTGLDGGGDLSADRTLNLNADTIAKLDKAGNSPLDIASNNGIFRKGRDEDNYGSVGIRAFDGSYSVTEGDFGATGNYSTAFGRETIAKSNYSTAFGRETIAEGYYSTAFGYKTIAKSNYSTAFGYKTIAEGDYSTAFGRETIAEGNYSTAFGYKTESPSYAEAALGAYGTEYTAMSKTSSVEEDRALGVGIGISDNRRKDGILLLKSGLLTAPEQTETLINSDEQALITRKYLENNAADGYGYWNINTGSTTTKINSENTLIFDDDFFELNGKTITFIGDVSGLPDDGNKGDLLVKQSNTDGDADWEGGFVKEEWLKCSREGADQLDYVFLDDLTSFSSEKEDANGMYLEFSGGTAYAGQYNLIKNPEPNTQYKIHLKASREGSNNGIIVYYTDSTESGGSLLRPTTGAEPNTQTFTTSAGKTVESVSWFGGNSDVYQYNLSIFKLDDEVDVQANPSGYYFINEAHCYNFAEKQWVVDKINEGGGGNGSDANVQSDWDVTSTSSDAFIKNKPTGLAKESWVLGKNYLTSHQSLSSYAKKSYVTSAIDDLFKLQTKFTAANRSITSSHNGHTIFLTGTATTKITTSEIPSYFECYLDNVKSGEAEISITKSSGWTVYYNGETTSKTSLYIIEGGKATVMRMLNEKKLLISGDVTE